MTFALAILLFLVVKLACAFGFQLAFNCLAPLFSGPALTFPQAFAAIFLFSIMVNGARRAFGGK